MSTAGKFAEKFFQDCIVVYVYVGIGIGIGVIYPD